ncbi:MAG: Spy/CpxP family protein refolding chaperone [Planktomarina sp.]
MTLRFALTLPLIMAFSPLPALAEGQGHGGHATPYAGFEARKIKSLSEADIEELQRGGGWGLALPAELNGRPGPAHILELQDELGLTEDQKTAITEIYESMRADAIAAGERFIAAEAALSDAFAAADLSSDDLRTLIDDAAKARADLRYIHLSQHLVTPEILSAAQVQKYNVLRGYADDPCANVPDGHNATLWRMHNGCD